MTLDAAWAAAEAAMPDGWAILSLQRNPDDGQWSAAAAADALLGPWSQRYRRVRGATPAAALLALAGVFPVER